MNKAQKSDHQFHSKSSSDVINFFETSVESGLTSGQYRQKIRQYGKNRLRKSERRSPIRILFEQFKSVVIAVLLVAALIAFLFQQWTEGIAISAVLIVNTLIGFFTEWKATRSMEALQKLDRHTIRVRREDKEQEVDTTSLVPGDVVIIESGDLVPGDIRLIEANNLRINESALTGESVPVLKTLDAAEKNAVLSERTSMLYKGTVATDGSGEGVVTAIGMETELGNISNLAEQAEKESTPLQKKLDNLGRKLAWITISIAVLIAVTGLIVGQDLRIMIETAIALGVAAIPEGLPIVATIALARGMYVMAQKNVLINKLQAVETLGSTGVIFTDKTGTLTENHMTLRAVNTPNKDFQLDEQNTNRDTSISDDDSLALRLLLKASVLCNNASITDEDNDQIAEEEQGDPTETALLRAGLNFGLKRDDLLSDFPEVREVSFDSETMMMATVHELRDQYYIAVKGAPEKVLQACSTRINDDKDSQEKLNENDIQQWLKRSEELANQGLRLLAVADKTVSDSDDEPYSDLRFLGLAGLMDPARSDVKSAIEECHKAGIRVIMVTGDQGPTAAAIAYETGISNEKNPRYIHSSDFKDPDTLDQAEREKILETNIFARVSPEQKLQLIEMMQNDGFTVAMTGDGINDTPALKKADIGIAMGKRGTDAARQIADMVLLDDAFKSIVTAVKYGRIIFGNIRKSVMFMLCTNVAEVLAVTAATVIGGFYFFPIPLLPLQILYLNVVTDVFPALALGLGTGEEDIMKKKPRPKNEPVLTFDHWKAIGGWSVIITLSVLGALAAAIYQAGFEAERAVTVSFLTLGFGKLWFTYNLRNPGSKFLSNDIVRNPYVAGSIVLCIFLLLATVYMPGLSDILGTRDPGVTGWYILLGMSLIPFIWGQILRSLQSVTGERAE
jgi:P-type Ca2+ transporter type 2C